MSPTAKTPAPCFIIKDHVGIKDTVVIILWAFASLMSYTITYLCFLNTSKYIYTALYVHTLAVFTYCVFYVLALNIV